MRFAHKHVQRADLHVSLVLVHTSRLSDSIQLPKVLDLLFSSSQCQGELRWEVS